MELYLSVFRKYLGKDRLSNLIFKYSDVFNILTDRVKGYELLI